MEKTKGMTKGRLITIHKIFDLLNVINSINGLCPGLRVE